MVGQTLRINHGFDSVRTESIDSLNLPAGVFLQAFRIDRSQPPDDPECSEQMVKYWVQPHVGIVRIYRQANGPCIIFGGYRKIIWELVSYSLGG